MQELSINADVIAADVGLGAELSDHGAVNLHSAFLNHLLGLATAGHTGLRKDLLQAFGLSGRARDGGETGLIVFIGLDRSGFGFGWVFFAA